MKIKLNFLSRTFKVVRRLIYCVRLKTEDWRAKTKVRDYWNLSIKTHWINSPRKRHQKPSWYLCLQRILSLCVCLRHLLTTKWQQTILAEKPEAFHDIILLDHQRIKSNKQTIQAINGWLLNDLTVVSQKSLSGWKQSRVVSSSIVVHVERYSLNAYSPFTIHHSQ